MDPYSRRDFFKITARALLAASGLLGVDGLLRYLSFSAEPPPRTEFALGPVADYPLGSRTLLADVPAVLVHNEQGFVAHSLVCPHLGCIVRDGAEGLVCPCHGSRFDAHGAPLRGPASEALRTLRVEVGDDDQLRLFLV